MWFHRDSAAFLLLLWVLAPGISVAQQTKQSTDAVLRKTKATSRPQPPLIGTDDGLSVISAALESRSRLPAKVDCSHLVHDIYERAGFSYIYASSSDLYNKADEFRRVIHPQPGDLVVWPGHVGIVINPAQRSFFSALTSGLGVDAYDSTYWKERGRPRFLRYVKANSTTNRPTSIRTPSLTTTALETTPGVRALDIKEKTVASIEPPSTDAPDDAVNLQVPRVQIIESSRPTAEEISQSLLQAFAQTGEKLREQDVFHLSKPVVVVRQFDVREVKIKGDQGWAELRISESASLSAGQSNLKKRQEKQRWLLRRRNQDTWEVTIPQTALYLSQDSAIQVLAHQLASLTESADDSSNNAQKAHLAQLLHALLEVRD